MQVYLRRANLSSRQLSVPAIVLAVIAALGCDSERAPQRDVSNVARTSAVGGTTNWLQFNFNPQHNGNNTSEFTLGPANVGGLLRLFQVTLPGVVDGAPVSLAAVSTPSGVRDLLFVTTKAGQIIAADAQTGATVWSNQYGPGNCHINTGTASCFTTSSPAIDPSRAFVYTYGLDGRVHKLAVATGLETTTGGWPQLTTLKGNDEKGSAPLTFATAANGMTYLYMAHGGYPGDQGDYQGHLTTIDLGTGAQSVFNVACSNQAVHFASAPATPSCAATQSALWARVGVVYDPTQDRIFVATGNGGYAPASHNWGDTVFSLTPGGLGANGDPLDSYTPASFQQLQNNDADLGSTEPAILPVPAGSRFPHLALQSGKDALVRLINLADLSGQGGPGHIAGEVGAIVGVPQGGQVLSAPAVWVNPADATTWIFLVNRNGASALRLGFDGAGTPQLTTMWTSPVGGSSPVVANNVLYHAGNAIIRALNPVTGAVLWSDTQIAGNHWQSPIVVNGAVYITDEGAHLTAYALPAGTGGSGGAGAGGTSGAGGVTGTGGAGTGGVTGAGGAGGPGSFTARINFQPAGGAGAERLQRRHRCRFRQPRQRAQLRLEHRQQRAGPRSRQRDFPH